MIADIVCESTNRLALLHYKQHEDHPEIWNATACLERRCPGASLSPGAAASRYYAEL